jgi:hypothetical protein
MENEKAVAEYRDEQMRQLSESEQIFKDAFLSAWDDMVNTGKIKWDELLKYLVAEFARRGIANLFDSIFTNSGGGGGGGFWSAAGNWISGLFGGARAGGGPVSAGKFYMVGEHGPEIMAAGMSGTVIPNHAIGGAITLAPTYNITNTSGDHRGLQRVMEENNRRMFETLERHYNLRPAT